MSKLTAKQEQFVLNLVSGMTQREAYKKAGYKFTNMRTNTIDHNASMLLKNTKVLTRYRELLKQYSNQSLWTRESAFNEYEWLKNQAKEDIQHEGVRHASSTAFIQALEGMNQMAFKDLDLADKKLAAEIARIEAETLKTKQITGETKEEIPDDGFLDALREEAADIWSNEQ